MAPDTLAAPSCPVPSDLRQRQGADLRCLNLGGKALGGCEHWPASVCGAFRRGCSTRGRAWLAFRVSSGPAFGWVLDPFSDLGPVQFGPVLAPLEPSSLGEYGRRSPQLQVVRPRLHLRALHLDLRLRRRHDRQLSRKAQPCPTHLARHGWGRNSHEVFFAAGRWSQSSLENRARTRPCSQAWPWVRAHG